MIKELSDSIDGCSPGRSIVVIDSLSLIDTAIDDPKINESNNFSLFTISAVDNKISGVQTACTSAKGGAAIEPSSGSGKNYPPSLREAIEEAPDVDTSYDKTKFKPRKTKKEMREDNRKCRRAAR